MAQETLEKFEGENKEISEDWEVVRGWERLSNLVESQEA